MNKVAEGRPHIVDMIKNGDVSFIVNTVEATRTAVSDSRSIRTTALAQRVTYYTTVAGAQGGLRRHEAPRRSSSPIVCRTCMRNCAIRRTTEP